MVDPPNVESRGRRWSHVASDASFEELHAFAEAARIPARGFDRDHYDVPADRLDALVAAGAVGRGQPVKVLGTGELGGVSVHVSAHAFSGSAAEKISAAGGSATRI